MRITFVHIADQVHYEPTTAQLAGLLKDRNWMPWHVMTDFSTNKDAFIAAVRANQPLGVAFRVTKQTREIVRYLASLVAEQPEKVPIFFYGPLAQTHPEEVLGMIDPSVVLTGDPEVGMSNIVKVWPKGPFPMTPPPGAWYSYQGQILKGEDGGPMQLTDLPRPDLTVFGGDRIFRRGIGASFFGELKVAPLHLGIGSPAGEPGNHSLLAFSAPTTYPPRLLDLDRIIFWLRALAPRVAHLEFWDREFGWNYEFAAELLPQLHRRQRKKSFTMRCLADSFDKRLLDLVDQDHSRRIVFELDSATRVHQAKVPGTTNPEVLEAVAADVRSRGLELGLLVSVGLPFETLEDLRSKLALIRRSGAARVRFLPFEPRYGHPVYDLCVAEKMLQGRGDEWNREVWRPLSQTSMSAEEWHVGWQECLNLQADLQINVAVDFETRAT